MQYKTIQNITIQCKLKQYRPDVIDLVVLFLESSFEFSPQLGDGRVGRVEAALGVLEGIGHIGQLRRQGLLLRLQLDALRLQLLESVVQLLDLPKGVPKGI